MTRLSKRQEEVAVLMAGGHTKDDVATLLGIKQRTVRSHAEMARWKLGVPSYRQFARALVADGYVSADEIIRRAA